MQGIAHYTLQVKVWALRGSSVLPSYWENCYFSAPIIRLEKPLADYCIASSLHEDSYQSWVAKYRLDK